MLALNPLNRIFKVQPTQNQVPVTKPKFKSVCRKSGRGCKRPNGQLLQYCWRDIMPCPAQPSPAQPRPAQPTQPQFQPQPQPGLPQPRPAQPTQPSPGSSPSPIFQNQDSVRKPGQNFRSKLSVKTFLAPKPLTISINPETADGAKPEL